MRTTTERETTETSPREEGTGTSTEITKSALINKRAVDLSVTEREDHIGLARLRRETRHLRPKLKI